MELLWENRSLLSSGVTSQLMMFVVINLIYGKRERPWVFALTNAMHFLLVNIVMDIFLKEKYGYETWFLIFLPLKEMDISGLLQNLLDNAIEASERIKGKNKKEIYLLIMENTEGWILKVSNFCDNPEQINFQTTKRDKKNHGYGIGIICDIVKQYNGTIKYVKSEEEKQVTVHIFFPKRQKKIL